MSKRCPPGVICFENITIVIIIILLCSILLYVHFTSGKKVNIRENIIQNNSEEMQLNPYGPPLQDDPYMPPRPPLRRGLVMPINVPTQPFDPVYRQVGILTRIKGKETILPLMGRPVLANRDKWNFYTMNDKNAMIKLPISFRNKSCTSEQGCDNLYNGDTVYVEGYGDTFRVTIYDNNSMEYIPYL